MRWQWGVPVLAALALVARPAIVESGEPPVRLSVDPHWNAHTYATPTFLGTITAPVAAVDPSSFVLFVDDREIYVSTVQWFRDPGSSFNHRVEDNDGRVVTWEYHQTCSRGFEEGRHVLRFEFRDVSGNAYGAETSIAFFVDRTPPAIRFDGLSVIAEDDGSGVFIDSRVEGYRASPCPEADVQRICGELARFASGWEIDCAEPWELGLSLDLWRVDDDDPRSRERTFLETERVGWTTVPVRSGNDVRVSVEPPGRRYRLAHGTAVQIAAYTRRLVVSAGTRAERSAEDLAAWLEEHALPFVFDARRNEMVVYIQGPADHAGNVTAPVFSGRVTADDGSPLRAERTQNVAQAEPLLEITDAMVAPNPFNPSSQNALITFTLSKPAELEILVYDWSGEFVDAVYRGSGVLGVNTAEWGGQTEDGRKLGNGTYLIRIVASTPARTESRVVKAVVWNDG